MSNPFIPSQKDAIHFITAWETLEDLAYANSAAKGFWDDNPKPPPTDLPAQAKHLMTAAPTKICLTHSELSEALEGIRAGDPPDDKIPEFTSSEAELADAVIRIMDMAKAFNLRVGRAVVAKMAFNATRPPKHGKAF